MPFTNTQQKKRKKKSSYADIPMQITHHAKEKEKERRRKTKRQITHAEFLLETQ